MTRHCDNEHDQVPDLEYLPSDQGGSGRHKCAACAYEAGFQEGLNKNETFEMNLNSLPKSQASSVRHKSAHAAYALGYHDGVVRSYDPPVIPQ